MQCQKQIWASLKRTCRLSLPWLPWLLGLAWSWNQRDLTQHSLLRTTLQVVDLAAGRAFKCLRAAHSNIASALSFRPHRPWELLSGGMDMTVAR